MDKTVLEYILKIKKSKRPEDIFGNDFLKVSYEYRRIAKIIHPDGFKKADEKSKAEDSLRLLNELREMAEKKVERNSYGKVEEKPKTLIRSATNSYELVKVIGSGDLAVVHKAKDSTGKDVVIKIVRSKENNDLLANESKKLSFLKRTGPTKDLKIISHIPNFVESFQIQDGRNLKNCNVFEFEEEMVDLQKVMDAYPNGVDGRTAAWIFNRMLAAMLAAHQAGIIHGAIIPTNFLINPDTHNGVLIDWCFSTKNGGTVEAISPNYSLNYPPEILEREKVSAATDIYMAAKCIISILGDNYSKDKIGPEYFGFLRYCSMESSSKRPNGAWILYEDFKEILLKTYGPPKFHPFKMK